MVMTAKQLRIRDVQLARLLLRSMWRTLDLGGESWGRSEFAERLEGAMGLLDAHFPINHELGHRMDTEPLKFYQEVEDILVNYRIIEAKKRMEEDTK
jgi:hypothetical protein